MSEPSLAEGISTAESEGKENGMWSQIVVQIPSKRTRSKTSVSFENRSSKQDRMPSIILVLKKVKQKGF